MKIEKGTSRKILIVFLGLLTLVLIGVSVFIALRLQEDQTPVTSSADTLCIGWVTTQNCGSGCADYFLSRPFCCIDKNYTGNTFGVPKCSDQQPPTPTECRVEYYGNSFRLIGDNCASKYDIQTCTVNYSGGGSLCPVTSNCVKTGEGDAATYSATPQPGQCSQIDFYEPSNPNNGGGVCDCNPPVVTETPLCNETCSDSLPCPSGLACTTISNNTKVCRLPSNPTSPTCEPSEDVPNPVISSICPTGATTPIGTINWTKPSVSYSGGYWIDIDDDNDWSNGYWNKYVSLSNTLSTQAPSGFNPANGETQTLVLNDLSTYYVRIYFDGIQTSVDEDKFSTTVAFTAAECVEEVVSLCLDLEENGSDPIALGANNVVMYTLRYQDDSTTNPFPNIGLVVEGNRGRDFNRKNQTVVAINPTNGVSNDPVTNVWTYRFTWEAADSTGTVITPLTSGTYSVRVLTNSSNASSAITTPVACTETITVSQTAVSEPLFNIVKQSSVICLPNGDSRIDYTITSSNISNVEGVIDFVEDTYDPVLSALGVVPINLDPSTGAISGGKIRWTGDTAFRTYAANQSKVFKYSMVVPASSILNFATTGVQNQAKVQYDTPTTVDNIVTFDLRTFLSCTVTSIPDTGILDDARFLLAGLIFISIGVYVYKNKVGYKLSESLIDGVETKVNKASRSIKPFEERLSDDLENKRKGRKRLKA